MTVELLIHAIVRQTTILIAQLATSRGLRAPLATVANQVFLDLVSELERQRVSRKVSADMFGLGLRTYRRKIQRLNASATERGRSLWEAILEYLTSHTGATREEILERFCDDDDAQVKAVLHDLCESQLAIPTPKGATTAYRAARGDELAALQTARGDQGLDDLILALTFGEAPLAIGDIASRARLGIDQVQPILNRLVEEGRIDRLEKEEEAPLYQASRLVIPLGAAAGWEGAVFDHFKALVTTIISRLREDSSPGPGDTTGGSTYTMGVWPGHPMADEVYGTLQRYREELSRMRDRADKLNATLDVPESYDRVVIYVGQSVIGEGNDGERED